MLNSIKKARKTNRGITLIALVITIIVLLILAGVTIATLTGDNGLLTKATGAKDTANETEVNEKIRLAYQDYYLGKHTNTNASFQDALDSVFGAGVVTASELDSNGVYTISVNGKAYSFNPATNGLELVALWIKNPDGSYSKGSTTGVQVGDTVNYETILASNAVDSTKKAQLITELGTYSGNTDSSKNTDSSVVRDSLTWKVLDVKDGKIRLISSAPTTSKIRLFGANGYNNAVYLIDKACDTLYSSNKGTAQNLKIEDIERTLTYDYTQYANPDVDTGKYGGTKEYTSNLQYPNIYASEIGCKAVASADNTGNTLGLSQQKSPVTGSSTASSRLKTTQTVWGKSMATSDFTDSNYYNLFINNGSSNYATYWLSSRCVYCYSSSAYFYVRRVDNGSVNYYGVFGSDGAADGITYAFRPVVSLESSIQLSGDSTNGWTIQ